MSGYNTDYSTDITIFCHTHPKIIEPTISFPEFVSACKKSFFPCVHSQDAVNFRVQRPDWPHPFLTMLKQKILDQFLTFVNLYWHAKNKVVSSICSGKMVDLQILQSDWLRAFWPLSQEQNFSKYRICARKQKTI